MDNPRPEKVAVVDEVRARLSSSNAALLTEYRGLKVGDLAALRRALRPVGGDFKIYKNTLVRFAVRELDVDGVEELLVGPTAIAFVEGDAAAVAKALRDYARTNPALVVKGGILGDKALSADEARALADLPSREVLLARFAGGLAAPLVQFAGLLQALPRNFAYGLKALIDQQGGVPEAAAPDPEPAPEAAPEPAPETPAAEAAPEATDTDAPAAEVPAAEPASEPEPAPEPAPEPQAAAEPEPEATETTDPPAEPEAETTDVPAEPDTETTDLPAQPEAADDQES